MKIPEDKDKTRDKIFKALESLNDGGLRDHLGASIIGEQCERSLFYTFRWATYRVHEGRLLRLFRRGQMEESMIELDLEMAGFEIYTKDSDGKQFGFGEFGGHFGGSCDGIISSGVPEAPKTPHIVEMKTHNDKSFNDLVKNGVKKSKPNHYAQMQVYMGLSEKEYGKRHMIDRALYIAVNKNDDNIYTERVKFDREYFNEIIEKAERIVFSNEAPSRISDNPSLFACKFCDHKEVCHGDAIPLPTCRSCVYSTPEKEGGWRCEKKNKTLSSNEQKLGCEDHMINPSMVDSWLNAIDGDSDYILFEKKGTTNTFKNGKDHVKTSDLFKMEDRSILFNENAQKIINKFGVTKVEIKKIENE